MAEQYRELSEKLIDFIRAQQLFFVGTAGAEGSVNISPKGLDSLRIISPVEVAWLNLTGSGNESAAHVLENRRMTIMFCSFDKQPLILRLYGEAEVIHPRDEDWEPLSGLFPPHPGARQLFRLRISLVQTSCGYAVPHYDFSGERSTLTKWAEKRGEQGVKQYWQDKNRLSMDGKDTGIIPEKRTL
ncbi:pyridoxamine 5'-phosphate oxidase family protein [Halopseudomonas sp.]|uniref:pyridoxamine 5'-phosphate oxidase family protein n=1 Tax=Halopseudomonas sp. TaxID=2901191 RepID=UPI0035620105